MKIAICQLTSEVSVLGARASLRIGPGAQVDLDQVIGDEAPVRDATGAVVQPARPCTLADALGPALLVHFVPVETSAPAARARAPRAAAESKE